MKKIIYTILATVVCLAMVFSFASCGENDDSTDKNTATIMLYLSGGSLDENSSTTYEEEIGAKLTFKEPTKNGFSFDYWADENGDPIKLPYTVSKDAVIVAVWENLNDNSNNDSNVDSDVNSDVDSDVDSDINSDTDNSNTDNSNTENTSCGAHDFGDWVESVAPNCVGDGIEEKVCFTCGSRETRPFESARKGECEYTNWVVALSAGCQDKGVKARVCKYCDNVETQVIPMITHEAADWIPTTPATCVETGIDTCNCRCEETRESEQLGHNIETAPGTAPTATTGGTTPYWTCIRCHAEGGENAIDCTANAENVASSATFSHNATDFHAFQPDKLYDGKENNGTRSPKGGDYSIFMDYTESQYVTSFKLKCNGAGSIPYGTTDLVYNIKNICINFYAFDGTQVYTTGTTDVSSSEYIECEVNDFVTKIEIQIFGGGHGGGEYLWEVYVMAPKRID